MRQEAEDIAFEEQVDGKYPSEASQVENKINTNSTQEYNPQKTYRWDKDTPFTFNGIQFNIMYNNMSEFMTQPTTPANILKLADVFATLQSKMIESVENGSVQEQEVEKQIVGKETIN